jgi:hypothetical protein
MTAMTAAGTVGVVATAFCWAFAVVLFRVGPRGSVAHKLALLLVVEGITLVSSGYIDKVMGISEQFYALYPEWSLSWFFVHTFGDCAMLALYPPFLAAALQTKLTRPFASKRMQIVMGLVAGMLFLAVQFSPLKVGALLLYVSLSILFTYALLASLHAWHIATTSIARARSATFALAFGIRDVCWGFIYTFAIWQVLTDTYLLDELAGRESILDWIYAMGTLLAIPVVTYGILRTQLFDIDLRIRWTIKQSTIAAIFVAVFYLVSEGADRLLSSEFGNIAGLLASALVVFFLVPLQRFADRVANAAMPNTENTPEYVVFRKLQVYESALVEAAQYEGITARERALLNRLRESLGIAASDAEAMERDLGISEPSAATR